MCMENRPKAILSDFRMVCKITRVGPTTGKEKVCFHSGPHDYDCVYKDAQCLLGGLCRCAGMTVLYIFFFFRLIGFWLNKAGEGTTNFAAVLGGYLSPYVVWGIDFLPPTTLMKPLLRVPLGIHLALITLSYLIWSLFKQEWMLRFASGVCLCMGPFLLVFVFKVKAWLMRLMFRNAVFVRLVTKSLSFICWKSNTQGMTDKQAMVFLH